MSLPRGGLILYLPDSSEGIDREETLGGLNITVATVLQARPRIAMEQEKVSTKSCIIHFISYYFRTT